ncbi:uncharacterized protein EAE98_004335 [Botrytis deweyae]|uniref:Uncharacterized protein n=1 Tax=Botrytis deweyae TaxID=2478750 RepID=A0ABQ7IQV5_9HELO|nr:uncharacterized protein EAE98_004335 [Botrytis deweyae]KAF7931599.1 hypothetical protein EAE98_004335 [Botrytis deweyae]
MQFLNITTSSLRVIFAIALFVLSAPTTAVPIPLSHTINLLALGILGFALDLFTGDILLREEAQCSGYDLGYSHASGECRNIFWYQHCGKEIEGPLGGPSEQPNSVTRANMALNAAVANDPWPDFDRGPSLYINSGVTSRKEN